MNRRARNAIAVIAAMFAGFALRVIPAWQSVFTPRGASFQEPDAWYHMRAIHNLAAHFPWRSGFDPYMLYRSSANVAIAPFWDYLVASAAWLAGFGSPSEKLVDQTGAWLPAILGALFPLLVFALARRLFGDLAGWLSAFWVAIVPGSFLWVTHLGMPDHHAIESLTSFGALWLVSVSVESRGKWRYGSAGLAGVVLGAYLNIRAAGIFVPGVLAAAALCESALADCVAVALGVACLAFLAGGGSPWSSYTWLALTAGVGVALVSLLIYRAAARRNWPLRILYGAMAGTMAAAVGGIAILDPAGARGVTAEISRFLPWHAGITLVDEVKELQPLWRATPGGFASVFNMFGGEWVPAIAGLALAAVALRRQRRPALTLFILWSVTMIAGVLFQVRMGAYAGVVVAILAGVASAWIVERVPPNLVWLRAVAGVILLAIGMATTVPFGVSETSIEGGPDTDWWSALSWLRANTPEPFGDAGAWYRLWPALRPGQAFRYPAPAYGILAPWDKGWWIAGIAHRIPVANGRQDGSVETARFLTETQPEEARRDAASDGARYAVVGPEGVGFGFPGLILEGGRGIDRYSRVFHIVRDDGGDLPLRVYLPGFYRSMVARLYLFDGRATNSAGAQVFVTELTRTEKGVERERFLSVWNFASEKEARAWMSEHASLRTTLASADAARSCVDTEDLPWAKLVFASNSGSIEGDRQPSVVKIFALGQ